MDDTKSFLKIKDRGQKNKKSRGKCSAIPGDEENAAQHAFGSEKTAGLDTKEARMYVCVCAGGDWIKSTVIRFKDRSHGGGGV